MKQKTASKEYSTEITETVGEVGTVFQKQKSKFQIQNPPIFSKFGTISGD